jgi:hypothetical protein
VHGSMPATSGTAETYGPNAEANLQSSTAANGRSRAHLEGCWRRQTTRGGTGRRATTSEKKLFAAELHGVGVLDLT